MYYRCSPNAVLRRPPNCPLPSKPFRLPRLWRKRTRRLYCVIARTAGPRAWWTWRPRVAPQSFILGIVVFPRPGQGVAMLHARRMRRHGTARNLLKNLRSDKGIQGNPSPVSWFGLDWLCFGLEEFGRGVTASAIRFWRVSRREWMKPVAGDVARSVLRVAKLQKVAPSALKSLPRLSTFARLNPQSAGGA